MDDKTNIDTTQIERRHLTVLECDLVGSTALAHKLDPEELRDLILGYQDCVLSWIDKLDGYFVQFAGDAIWVYFGYPKAHEDDAIRAIQAGLGMTKAVGSIELHGESLSVRVGIASGLCIVGNLRQQSNNDTRNSDSYITAIGDPPNLAARLQALVKPGAVAVSDETRSLVGKLFEFEDMGFYELKGFTGKTRAWRAIGGSGEKSRFRALRPLTQSPLIGRSNELESIAGLWNETCKKNGQIVYLSGDPSIGKSRLVASVAEDIVGPNYPQWWLQCSEHLQHSAFAPIITHIQSQAGFTDADTRSFETLVQHFPELDDEAHNLLAELLSIEANCELETAQMSASGRRERLYEVLIDLVEATSKNKPLLFVVEDMHWIDPSTQALLQRLTLRSANIPLLMLITSRDINDSDKSFMELFHVHNFHIEQLQRDDCFTLINALWEGEQLPAAIAEQIVKQTDGVPLFIEDVIFSIRYSADYDPGDIFNGEITVPTKLSDHLMSRIDKLGDSKRIAQIGAVVGREFSLAIMESLTKLSADALRKKLATLIDAGLLMEAEQNDEQSYGFKHAMIRDAAYDSLLISHRKELHKSIANWLASERPTLRFSQPETIAYHYKHAGVFNLAIDYWLEAGKRSKSRSNYAEASMHLKNAHELIPKLSPSALRDRIELDITITQAPAEAGAFGISWEGTGKAYDRARQLCKALDYPDDIFPVLSGAGSFHFLRANYEKVCEIAEQSIQLAKEKSNKTGDVIGNRILGAVQFVTGDFNDSIELLQSAINIYDEDPDFHQSYALAYAMDHKTSSLCYLALANMVIGEIDVALDISRQSVIHSETIDLHTMNYALCYQAGMRHFRDDAPETTLNVATRSFELSVKEGYASWIGMSRLIKGESMIRLGNTVEGMIEIEKGVSEHSNVMAQSFLPFAQTVLAKGYLATNQFNMALKVLIKTEALSVKTRQYWYLPEVQRLHAETLIQMEKFKAAEESYLKALNSAKKIGATFWLGKIERSMTTNSVYLENLTYSEFP